LEKTPLQATENKRPSKPILVAEILPQAAKFFAGMEPALGRTLCSPETHPQSIDMQGGAEAG
jgi:hypothetical protein